MYTEKTCFAQLFNCMMCAVDRIFREYRKIISHFYENEVANLILRELCFLIQSALPVIHAQLFCRSPSCQRDSDSDSLHASSIVKFGQQRYNQISIGSLLWSSLFQLVQNWRPVFFVNFLVEVLHSCILFLRSSFKNCLQQSFVSQNTSLHLSITFYRHGFAHSTLRFRISWL